MSENKSLSEWFEENNNYGIFYPPMKAELFIKYITEYLLDEDWYTINPINQEQVYTEILLNVLSIYSKKFKKEKRNSNKHKG